MAVARGVAGRGRVLVVPRAIVCMTQNTQDTRGKTSSIYNFRILWMSVGSLGIRQDNIIDFCSGQQVNGSTYSPRSPPATLVQQLEALKFGATAVLRLLREG